MHDEKPDPGKDGKAKRAFRSQPSRAVIISALAAGGVFQLNGWQVQAHGNRSSHAVASMSTVAFTPADYVLTRPSAEPNAQAARQLALVTEQLRGNRLAANAPEVQRLQALKAGLESQLQLGSTVRQSVEFVRQGDVDAAIAMIEGEGSPARVLAEYNWTLLDVAYMGREGNVFTASHMNEFVTLSKAAMAYSEKALRSHPADRLVKEQVAEIYHNVASFTLPDDGAASASDLKLGRGAAEQALNLRQELGQKYETMVAYQMVGKHYLRAHQTEKARATFEAALKIATDLNDLPGIGWSKAELAKSVQKSDAQKARSLRSDAVRIAQKAEPKDVSLQALRLELSGK